MPRARTCTYDFKKQTLYSFFLLVFIRSVPQDLKRLYTTTHGIIVLLKYFSVDHEKVAMYADLSLDEFITNKLSPRLREILADPNVAQEPPSRGRRMLKFEHAVN